MPGKPPVSDDDLFEIATYLRRLDVRAEIHAEMPAIFQDDFEAEYAERTDDFPLPPVSRHPYYIWPVGTNKYGRQLRIYLRRSAPEPPAIQTLYTDHGKWYARSEHYRINHSSLVMQLLECGFVLGGNQDNDRIATYMRRRFPVAGGVE